MSERVSHPPPPPKKKDPLLTWDLQPDVCGGKENSSFTGGSSISIDFLANQESDVQKRWRERLN